MGQEGMPPSAPRRNRPNTPPACRTTFRPNGARCLSYSSRTVSVSFFTNGLDPVPRSRQVFNFPRPETVAE